MLNKKNKIIENERKMLHVDDNLLFNPYYF